MTFLFSLVQPYRMIVEKMASEMWKPSVANTLNTESTVQILPWKRVLHRCAVHNSAKSVRTRYFFRGMVNLFLAIFVQWISTQLYFVYCAVWSTNSSHSQSTCSVDLAPILECLLSFTTSPNPLSNSLQKTFTAKCGR